VDYPNEILGPDLTGDKHGPIGIEPTFQSIVK
jgi:hypothetical protein